MLTSDQGQKQWDQKLVAALSHSNCVFPLYLSDPCASEQSSVCKTDPISIQHNIGRFVCCCCPVHNSSLKWSASYIKHGWLWQLCILPTWFPEEKMTPAKPLLWWILLPMLSFSLEDMSTGRGTTMQIREQRPLQWAGLSEEATIIHSCQTLLWELLSRAGTCCNNFKFHCVCKSRDQN